MTFNRNIEDPLYRNMKRIFKNNKRLKCSRCGSSDFEIIDTPQTKVNIYWLVCAKCRSVSNDDVELKKDKNPSALLMSVIKE
jgi:transcription elongation factor Elf1